MTDQTPSAAREPRTVPSPRRGSAALVVLLVLVALVVGACAGTSSDVPFGPAGGNTGGDA